MSFYPALRPLLFLPEAERSHRIILRALALAARSPMLCNSLARLAAGEGEGKGGCDMTVRAMGLCFPNPLGLAAGLDKDAVAVDAFAALGFGFVEVGTVTPLPQPGNPRPRLFRLPEAGALINRMGFNSAGAGAVLRHLRRRRSAVVVGVNLGKNAATPMAGAVQDYVHGLGAAAGVADYVAVNISSPNTPRLRDLHGAGALATLLAALMEKRKSLDKPPPIALKVSPDLSDGDIAAVTEVLSDHPVDAVIAANTTVRRDPIAGHRHAAEAGGLSGAPLGGLSTAVIAKFHARLQGRIPIIGAGGISNADDAWEKLRAGADLLQLYTALIYHGPGLAAAIVRGLQKKVRAMGCGSLREAVAQIRSR